MSKVLITGGTGLIGSRLSSLLKAKGYEVIILTRNYYDRTKFSEDYDISTYAF